MIGTLCGHTLDKKKTSKHCEEQHTKDPEWHKSTNIAHVTRLHVTSEHAQFHTCMQARNRLHTWRNVQKNSQTFRNL